MVLTGAILLRHSAAAGLLSLSLGRLSLMAALLTGLAAQRARYTTSRSKP